MQIVVLDADINRSSQLICDEDLRASLLSLAWLLKGYTSHKVELPRTDTHLHIIYRYQNRFLYYYDIFEKYLTEYRFRFGKPHAFEEHLDSLKISNCTAHSWTALPDKVKNTAIFTGPAFCEKESVQESWETVYKDRFKHVAMGQYTNRPVPEFVQHLVNHERAIPLGRLVHE
jgi:hypothetical protein